MTTIKNFYKYDLGYALVFTVLFALTLGWAAFSVYIMITVATLALYILVPLLVVGFTGMWIYMFKSFKEVYG